MELTRRKLTSCGLLVLLILGSVDGDCDRNECQGNKECIYIQGFVPKQNPTFSAEAVIPAARLAIQDLNNSTKYLPDHELVLEFANTKCDPAEATWQLIRSVIRSPTPTKVMLLGGGCSPATEPLAALAGLFYNLTQISYLSSSPSLSEREKFSRFFRTIPSEEATSTARLALLERYNWQRVALLYETQTIYATTVQQFVHMVPKNDSLLVRSFTRDATIHLERIKNQDYRIIFGWFYEEKALDTFCKAINMGLVSKDHVWVMPVLSENWFRNVTDKEGASCSQADIENALLTNVLFIDPYPWDPDDNATADSGRNRTNFEKEYEKARNDCNTSKDVGVHFGSFTYDAVWAIGIALNNAINNNISVADFSSNDTQLADALTQQMQQVEFQGISGYIEFEDGTGDRIGYSAVYQYNESLKLEIVSRIEQNRVTEPTNKFEFCGNRTDFMWKGGSAPKDHRTPVYKHLDHGLIYLCFVLVPCGLLFIIALFIFNIVTINKPLMTNSSPHMNNIILVGAMFMVLSPISLSFDSDYPDPFVLPNAANVTDVDGDVDGDAKDRYTAWCHVRLWWLVLGFTFSFGALFSKMWQIYRLYTNPKLKKQPLPLCNFFFPLGVFLFLDLAVLIPWTILYPLEWTEEKDVSDDGNTEVHHEFCSCNKFGYWIGAVYVYKGLLVVFSLFLAYESRNVKAYYVNDSKHVIFALLSAVLLIGSGGPVSLVLALFFIPNGAYIVAVIPIVLACVCSTGILFVPKMVWMYKGKETFVPDALQDTQEEQSPSSDNVLGQEMNQIKTAETDAKAQNDTTSSSEPVVCSDRRGSSNTESDSGVQSEDLAYNITHRKGSV
ncbi:gamma-aminobutyric acid type B receptor subunit 1-like [Dysidea avara]|uniref:gamma-aminobutyric acid type B receptor subunit 1-like n=1 Tax=Dysidea avara TaxID=196820 RepID=UPI0033175DE8